MTAISHSFGSVQALCDVSFTLEPGKIHALVGENGAGKSTLMRVLSGMLDPDEGTVEIGKSSSSSGSPSTSRVGFVQQEGGLIKELTGAENLILALGHSVIARRSSAAEMLTTLAAELDLEIDPFTRVGELAVGEAQRLEVLIALSTGAEILILDEPTAAMGTRDADILMTVLRRLAASGRTIVYVSHKLKEILQIGDTVTVMRRGVVVAEHRAQDLSASQLAEEMIGDISEAQSNDRSTAPPPAATEDATSQEPTVVLRLEAVSLSAQPGRHPLHSVDLLVRSGEVVGIAGVVGNGQDTLAEVLAGFTGPDDGAIEWARGRPAYIAEDRKRDSIAVALSLRDNAIVHSHRRAELGSRWRLSSANTDNFAKAMIEKARVASWGTAQLSGTLSGGNQQRLVVARELEAHGSAPCIIAHNPYRGLDLQTTRDVRAQLLAARGSGAGVVLISPDLEDLFDISDRILVLYGGAIIGEVDPQTTTTRELGELIGGSRGIDQH